MTTSIFIAANKAKDKKPVFFSHQKTLLGQQLVGAPLYNSRHFVPYVTAAKASLPQVLPATSSYQCAR
jgi:hypothetical protein